MILLLIQELSWNVHILVNYTEKSWKMDKVIGCLRRNSGTRDTTLSQLRSPDNSTEAGGEHAMMPLSRVILTESLLDPKWMLLTTSVSHLSNEQISKFWEDLNWPNKTFLEYQLRNLSPNRIFPIQRSKLMSITRRPQSEHSLMMKKSPTSRVTGAMRMRRRKRKALARARKSEEQEL